MKRGEDRATSLRRFARLVILPALAVAPVFAGFRTRDVAPAVSETLSPVYFAAGTTETRPRDMKILDAYAMRLRGEAKRVLLIEGHTDEPGDSAFSREVGEQRAESTTPLDTR